jgi:hypothetical protein
VIVTRSLERFGLDTSGSFNKKLERLKNYATTKGVELPDLLAKGFYNPVRAKVLHAGKEPTQSEVKAISEFVSEFWEAVKKL